MGLWCLFFFPFHLLCVWMIFPPSSFKNPWNIEWRDPRELCSLLLFFLLDGKGKKGRIRCTVCTCLVHTGLLAAYRGSSENGVEG